MRQLRRQQNVNYPVRRRRSNNSHVVVAVSPLPPFNGPCCCGYPWCKLYSNLVFSMTILAFILDETCLQLKRGSDVVVFQVTRLTEGPPSGQINGTRRCVLGSRGNNFASSGSLHFSVVMVFFIHSILQNDRCHNAHSLTQPATRQLKGPVLGCLLHRKVAQFFTPIPETMNVWI